MVAQLSFASLDFVGKKKRTKRDDTGRNGGGSAVVRLEALIEPRYPKAGPGGRASAFQQDDVAPLLPAAVVQPV